MKQIRIVRCDDWEAMYVDGVSVHQAHEIPVEHLIDLLREHACIELDMEIVHAEEEDEDICHDYGQLPELASQFLKTKL